MSRQKKFVAGLLAAIMLLTPVIHSNTYKVSAEEPKSSSAIRTEIDAIKEKKKGIDAEIQKLDEKITQNNDKMTDVVNNKNILEQEIFLLHEKVKNINDQISSHSLLIADHQQELVQAEANLEQLNEKYKARIQIMEEASNLSYWSVLFRANSFTDLLDRLVMIEEIAASDQRRLNEMRAAAQQVADAKSKLEAEKKDLDASRADLDKSMTEMEEKSAQADELLNQLLASGMEYQALLSEASMRNNEINAEISNLESQYDQAKDREYLESHPQQPEVKPTPPVEPEEPEKETEPKDEGNETDPEETTSPEDENFTWIVPINYTMVTSPFGWRVHPIYHTQRLHAGIDLAAPKGTPIVASRSGVVSAATYDGSAGYYVSINHMDGYSTRYMHMTHFTVYAGQNVKAGQIIGYCGSTGLSTGPHLHFGVYYNGTPINPAPFIGL